MVEAFHDVQFPPGVALGARGGPARRTDIVQLSSGQERRIARWSRSRRRYNAGYGLRTAADLETVVAFFEARQGRRFAFRWRDPFDSSSAMAGGAPGPLDQNIGTGDGATTGFQLLKTYSSGGEDEPRPILLPEAGSVTVAVDGIVLSPAEFDIGGNGQVQLSSAPPADATITAGFRFDIAARFDTDELQLTLEPGGGSIPDIPIVEVLG